MEANLWNRPEEVSDKLAQLGLTEAPLKESVIRGYFAWTNCTDNHPPLYPSIVAWAETVRALREVLRPLAWTRLDEGNYSRVVSPTGNIAIVVATGDERTGLVEQGDPTTKNPKGPNTVEAVAVNKNQLTLFPTYEPNSGDSQITWILLIHRAEDAVRCELSLPYSMGMDGRIDCWSERIILGSIPLEGDSVEIERSPSPDLDINIQRRA